MSQDVPRPLWHHRQAAMLAASAPQCLHAWRIRFGVALHPFPDKSTELCFDLLRSLIMSDLYHDLYHDLSIYIYHYMSFMSIYIYMYTYIYHISFINISFYIYQNLSNIYLSQVVRSCQIFTCFPTFSELLQTVQGQLSFHQASESCLGKKHQWLVGNHGENLWEIYGKSMEINRMRVVLSC